MTSPGQRVVLQGDELVVDGTLRISFQRTLRVPNDGRRYPLPAGLGLFPIRAVRRLPRSSGGWAPEDYAIPMYVREAMWLGFYVSGQQAFAVQVGLGRVNAVSGHPWTQGLRAAPQDYLVVPQQPWLDGVVTSTGLVRQFVAVPLTAGGTVEEQLTGRSGDAVLRLRALPPRPDRPAPLHSRSVKVGPPRAESGHALGLGAGGQLRQAVYSDPFGVETWDEARAVEIVVHVVDSRHWADFTAESPPPTPISASTYRDAGLPWFELYDETASVVTTSGELAGLPGVDVVDTERANDATTGESRVDVTEADVSVIRVTDADDQDVRRG